MHKLDWHGDIVRDMSWHPYQPMLISSAFDGTLCKWEHCPKGAVSVPVTQVVICGSVAVSYSTQPVCMA